jgi:hypothetical protein
VPIVLLLSKTTAMKKFVIILILLAAISIWMRGISAAANPVNNDNRVEAQQPDTSKHQIIKKRSRHIRRHVSATRQQRMRMQLRQANKHIEADKKAQRAQNELKKEQQ